MRRARIGLVLAALLALSLVPPASAGGHPRDLLLTTVTSANYFSVADAGSLDEIAQIGGDATAPSVPEVMPGGRKVYVQYAGKDKGSVGVFDVRSLRLTHHLEPSGNIGDRSARIQRDGRFYYYASIPDGDLTQFDTRTDRVSKVFAGLGNIFTVSPDGATIFVSGETDLSAVDARTGQVLGTVPLPSGGVPLVNGGVGWLMISPDGTTVVKMSQPVAVLDVRDRAHMTLLGTVPVGSNPTLGDISPDSRQLWVPNSGDGTISVIDLHSLAVVHTIETGRYLTALTFDPSGRHVYVAQDRPGGIGPNQADLVLLYVGQVAAGQFTAPERGQYTSRPVLDTPGRVVKYDVAGYRLSSAEPLLTVTVPVQLVAFRVR